MLDESTPPARTIQPAAAEPHTFIVTRICPAAGAAESISISRNASRAPHAPRAPQRPSTEEEEVTYKEAIERFFEFLDTLPAGIKFSPTHFYALFTHFLHEGSEREEILRGHMAGWTKDGVSKEAKKMWEKGHSKDERVAYFNHCLDSLERIKHVAREVGARKSIPKKIRDKCWSSVFGKAETGTCHCCSEEITLTTWHCGHIIAHAQGGDDSLSNLRPVCGSCNCSMGTENMDDFKKRCYPQNGGGC